MGEITIGIPKKLIKFLKREYKVKYFIETGTYIGSSSLWAADIFKNVFTIEAQKQIYENSKRKLSEKKNIKCYFGNSKNIIPKILRKFDKNSRIIFWLDAHWSVGNTFGEKEECPLLGELHHIKQFTGDSIIVIDDARLFLSPPPLPHNPTHWPTISQITTLLQKHKIYVFEDVILAIPVKINQRKIIRWIQEKNTKRHKKMFSNRKKSIFSKIKYLCR